jgi:hypothetical protein
MNQIKPIPEPMETEELLLQLEDVSHLFNAPSLAPLSSGPTEGLGVSGVAHLLNLLHLDKKRQRLRTLSLQLPAEKAASASPEQLTEAVRRHAQWRIEHEQREMRNTYRYGWKVTGFALVMLAVCLALSSLFASDLTEWMRPLIRKTFEYGFEIIGWVLLWHPIDLLVFTPVAIRARLAALKTLASVDVVICQTPKQI